MMTPFTLSQAPCAGPPCNLLHLVVVGFVAWGLWQVAKKIVTRLASRRGTQDPGTGHPFRTGLVFAGLVACVLLVLGVANALRSTPVVEHTATAHPRMIFLGAGKCRPCQELEPVRATLIGTYADALIVEYHDVWKDPDVGHRFGIQTIPTTLFVAPDGRELHRQQGYLSEDDIINQWRELGFVLKKGTHEK